MARVICKSLFILLVAMLLVPSVGNAQTNPHSQYRDIIGSDFNSSYINSAIHPKVIAAPEIGVFLVENDQVGENVYRYTYQPTISEGNTKAVIEYYKYDLQSGMLVPGYTTIYFRITKSLINCREDRKTIDVNSNAFGIDVLENDSRTNGPLELKSILYVEGGTATIVDGKIDFSAEADFKGDAFVYYSVEDQVGKSGTGILKIKILDPIEVPLIEELHIVSYGGEQVEIDLPYEGFELESTLLYGKFETLGGSQVYTPNGNFSGSESFVVSRGSVVRNVNVDMVEKPRDNSWVVDDVRYTSKGVPVTLDVTKNDYVKNKTILYTSADLVQQEAYDGLFTYSPPSYYQGTRRMEYTVYNGFETETGKVTVHVNNFNPLTNFDYNFTTVSNSALVVNYNIPISNYSFEIIESPNHGQVVVNTGNSSIDLGCEMISGRNLIIYEPTYNYKGSDEFKVRYCVDGKCKNVSITVEVIENDLLECGCYTGCVWAGDANNDGVVNASDLISMAYALGATGNETDWNGGSGWIGRNTADWLEESSAGINAKYADSDGNGIVDEVDFDDIYEHYNENHALVPPQILNNKSFPFTIKPLQDTVYVGDLLSIDIGIGTATYPALNVNGLVFSLGFPPDVVDSSSVVMNYHSDSWFGVDEKVVGILKQIRDGWIETGVTRLGKKPKSGVGTLGTLDFIVEEDVVGGFRVAKDGIIPLIFNIYDAKVMGGDGQMYEVPGAQTTVYLNLNERKRVDDDAELVVYPNPASEELNVHMQGGHEILSYDIYNVTGKLIASASGASSRTKKVALTNYNQGIYIIRAVTSIGSRTIKFEVF